MLRILIADDEQLALDRLGDLLAQLKQIELVGATQSGAEAISLAEKLRPDLIMLDIEMPKIDGFDVVEALARRAPEGLGQPPLVCFVTAFPHFAASAFDTGALDFLCKPVRASRLEETIDRARRAISQRDASVRLEELSGQLDRLRETRRGSATETSLWVHQRGQMLRIAFDSLEWVEAEGEYVRLHVDGQSFLLRGSISALADRLADHGFLRIHRSTIINQSRIKTIKSNRSRISAVLDSGQELSVGRKYRPAVRAFHHGLGGHGETPFSSLSIGDSED